MKHFNKIVIGLLLVATLCSCSMFSGGKNKNAVKEDTARAKVESVESQMGSNLKDKLNQVAKLNYGVDYALTKETDPSKNVQIAKDLNTRSMSLTGTPTIEEINKMKQMIDDLTSQLQTEKERGAKELAVRDVELTNLQLQTKNLEKLKDAEIQKYMKIAADTAAKADEIQGELNKMDSFMGLGAIWYGVKRLVVRLAWILGIGSILFLILRFASLSNPIAASIFSIFNTIGSWMVNTIAAIFPKALEIAGHTLTTVSNKYRDTMTKIIDGIETLRQQQKASGDVNKKYTIDELLTELSKTMDGDEKAMVDKIKRDIGFQ
jgi:hypothetical protein